MLKSKDTHEKSIAAFRKFGGIVKTSDAISAGIHPRTFYEMLSEGVIEKLSRGLYRLVELPPIENPDLVSVSKRVPNGIICIISALAFYEITTQIPHEIYLAVSRNSQVPRIDYPPVRIFRFYKAHLPKVLTYKRLMECLYACIARLKL